MFSARDVEMARERLLLGSGAETKTFSNKDDIHNNFGGLTWGLLSRGKIFAKASGAKKGKYAVLMMFKLFANKIGLLSSSTYLLSFLWTLKLAHLVVWSL